MRCEFVGASVQGEQFLARAPQADRNAAGADVRRVERVQRLAEFEHHEIGDIDDVVDRAHADGFQFRAQPIRARADAHAVNDPRRIIRARLAGVGRDVDRQDQLTGRRRRAFP